ncbi:hypothetical protein LCGC14_1847940 [marine sediment metagenome]|uniref:Uncharacterized protein n=1 Tax=marine sediment metagenome TaxID=412755 RepID=A0A0F9GB59_9ZZZZ
MTKYTKCFDDEFDKTRSYSVLDAGLSVIKVKKIYKLVFKAWYLIRDLKDELIKIKDEIKSVIEATETNDAPVDFTLNRLKNIL